MKLKIKDIDLSSGGPLVAVLNKEDALKYDLHASDRVIIKKDKKCIVAILDIAEDKKIKPGQIGLFEETLQELNVKLPSFVEVSLSKNLTSLDYIKKKLQGKRLNQQEFDSIIKDIRNNTLSEIELTYFVSACFSNELNNDETVALTKAIVNNGETLKIKNYPILDKHSIGGIPGNRTTLIITPIIAAAGFTIPKTSSRSISTAAGTADTMEVLSKVSFTIPQLKQIIKKTKACIAWGGGLNLASADDKLIRVRHSLRLDPEGMMISSIMAKKAAVGATHVLIDIPIGENTKIKTKKEARHLKKRFIKLGKKLHIKVKTYFSDGSQPIGNGIGPALEARDALLVLQGEGPRDLRDKSIEIASLLLKMAKVKKSRKKAIEILDSGSAYKKFKEIIKAQGGKPSIQPGDIKLGNFTHNVKSSKKGFINEINNDNISKLARIAGAPKDKGAGIYLNVHRHDKIKKGDILFTVYSQSKKRMKYALDFLKHNNPILIR